MHKTQDSFETEPLPHVDFIPRSFGELLPETQELLDVAYEKRNKAFTESIGLFEEGELDAEELVAVMRGLIDAHDLLLVGIITYGRYSEIQIQRWEAEQAAFFGHNPNFSLECNPILYNALNVEVLRIASSTEARGKTGLQILYEAKATIETIFGKGEA